MATQQLKRGDRVFSRSTGARGIVTASGSSFAVKYGYKGKTYNRFSNPSFWRKRYN